MVAGAHRRRTSSARPNRGAVWTGLFLLLAIVAVVASRGLWSGMLAGLLNFRPASAPQATVLWQAPCPVGSIVSVSSAGTVLVATGAGDPSATALAVAEGGQVTAVASAPGIPVAAAFYDPGFSEPPGKRVYALTDWRAVVVRTAQTGDTEPAGAGPGLLTDEVYCLEPTGGGETPIFVTNDAVVTAACSWADQAEIVLGLFYPAGAGDPQGLVQAIGAGGAKLWSQSLGPSPVHRLAARPGSGFVVAATPETVALFDVRGNLLWTKKLKWPIVDVALQSHGGPVVATPETLFAYDRRGNLIWKKASKEPIRAAACAGSRIAVAAGSGVVVYDEDGLEEWSLACSASALDIGLDPAGNLVVVLLESATLVVARAPGATAVGATSVAEEGRRP